MLIVDQWQSFENDIQNLRQATASKLTTGKAQELETAYGRFLMEVTTANGVTAPPAKEQSKIHVFNTRAALMMLLISWVPSFTQD